jgi:hypothetical protein
MEGARSRHTFGSSVDPRHPRLDSSANRMCVRCGDVRVSVSPSRHHSYDHYYGVGVGTLDDVEVRVNIVRAHVVCMPTARLGSITS